MTARRLFIITGDVSGDIHAAEVIRRLQTLSPDMQIEAIGGAHIAATGVPIFHRQETMGALGMGIIEAIPSHYLLGKRLLKHLASFRPDAVLLIDYGMFNLWIAKSLKAMGIRVFYYIPPQVWASRRRRLKTIRASVDHVFCIFPFEPPIYEAAGIPVTFVGHPLAEELPPPPDREAFCLAHQLDPGQPILGLFPGSRKSEVSGLLPKMLASLPAIQRQLDQPLQCVIARASAVPDAIFDRAMRHAAHLPESVRLTVIRNANHAILGLSRAVLVASGTVTLEAALYQAPMVITYPISRPAYWLFKRYSYVRHIGLPNLLSGESEAVFPELIMENANPDAYATHVLRFLQETPERENAVALCQQIRHQLGHEPASSNVAQHLLKLLDTPEHTR